MKVLHIITGLDVGGAETMLARLIERSDRSAITTTVISLSTSGPIGERLRAGGIPVHALGMRPNRPDPRALWRLVRLIRRIAPDVVQTWMYHADLAGGLAARLAGVRSVVWGIHHSNLSPAVNKRSTLLVARCCARLSRFVPARIVLCADAARRTHERIGYDTARMSTIPNGFDTATFRPRAGARPAIRAELGLAPQTQLVGMMSRWDPIKDHHTFIYAAGAVAARHPDARFVLTGTGITTGNDVLRGWIADAGIEDRCHLLGRRDDMPVLLASLDVAVSSSAGEAFPLVVGEAMTSGVPCAATDAGDTATLIGATGRVVPPGDPAALGEAISSLLALDPEVRAVLGAEARARIVERYALDTIVAAYHGLYRSLAGSTAPPAALEVTA